MTTKTLTDSAIKALNPGDTVWDAKVAGLHVRASAKAKAYYLFFRTKAGVERRPKLGSADVLPLADARTIARGMLATVAAGGDPMVDRSNARQEPTVATFFEDCWREHWSKTKDARNVRRIFDRRIAPRLGGDRIRTVQYADVSGMHRALEDTPYEANRALALTSRLLNLAERHGHRPVGSNPCRHVARFPELSRKRFASIEELAAIGKAMDLQYDALPASTTFIALLIFTGMRPSEVAAARRDQVLRSKDGGVLRLPDGKTGQRDVYLSGHALKAIDKLDAPKDGTLTGIGYPRVAWERIREAAGCPDLRMYDLRRTFATVSLAGGQSIGLIGEVLGHKTAQTTKVYARLMSGAASGLVANTGDRMQAMLSPPAPASR